MIVLKHNKRETYAIPCTTPTMLNDIPNSSRCPKSRLNSCLYPSLAKRSSSVNDSCTVKVSSTLGEASMARGEEIETFALEVDIAMRWIKRMRHSPESYVYITRA